MLSIKTKQCLLPFLLLLILMVPGCAEEETAQPEKITVLLDWTPNTNYSGIYAAIEEGYYSNNDLEVEVVQAPGSVAQMVATGQAQFGISYQEEVTYARLGEMPIVSIAAILQENTSGFASLKEQGIETPADFEGKSYGGWGSPIEEATIKALMDIYQADFESVDIITTGEVDSIIVMQREADFVWIYYGWTGIEAELQGLDLNFIPLREEDPSLNYYTPVIITSEALIEENPELVEKFIQATARGYRLAIEDPNTAASHLLTHAPELEEELVLASQKWLADYYQGEADTWGIQNRGTWENYSRWLYQYDLIDEIPDIDSAFTNEFLR